MKHTKSDVRRKFSSHLNLRFDDQRLTSFAGLIVFHRLFVNLSLRRRLTRCFSSTADSRSFSPASIVVLLIVSVLLGYRRLYSTSKTIRWLYVSLV